MDNLLQLAKIFVFAQWKRNYDMGEGFYAQMQKYKSVSDFRKKRRKKRKEQIEKLRAPKCD